MPQNHTEIVTKNFLRRHRAKCAVCQHPDREEIEEEYLHWHDVWQIAQQYEIDDYRSIHRHARAYGLVQSRRENIFSALDNIVEKSEDAKVTGDMVIRAIRAYSCITASGQWIEPPARVVFTTERPVFPVSTTPRILEAAESQFTMQNTAQNAAETGEKTALTVFHGASSPDDPPQDPTFAAVEQQNATATPPQAHRRRKQVASRVGSSLIYGTGINSSRKRHNPKEKTFSNLR
jgi:hypothetical protein